MFKLPDCWVGCIHCIYSLKQLSWPAHLNHSTRPFVINNILGIKKTFFGIFPFFFFSFKFLFEPNNGCDGSWWLVNCFVNDSKTFGKQLIKVFPYFFSPRPFYSIDYACVLFGLHQFFVYCISHNRHIELQRKWKRKMKKQIMKIGWFDSIETV